MLWVSHFLILLTYGSGCFAQYVLTQPPSVSVSLAETVQITCLGDRIGGKSVHWYQQKSNKAPVLVIYDDTDRPSGISDRFSGSNSGNTARLTIRTARSEDEGGYFCQTWDSDTYIFGGGTELFITGGPQSPPTVNLYCPSKEEMASKRTATIPCMVNDYNPSPATAIWEVGGTAVSNGVQTTKPVKDNGKYMFSSYLTVTDSEWERDIPHTCKVRHEGQDYMKSVSQSQCP